MSYTIPQLYLHDETSDEEFAEYFDELKKSITTSKPVRDRDLTVAQCTKDAENKIPAKYLLQFVPLMYQECEVTALFHAEHNYLVGFLTKEVESTGRPFRRCYLLYEEIPETVEKKENIQNCLNIRYSNSKNIIKVTGMGDAYKQMEEKAGRKRSQVVLGRASLISAIKFLSTTDEDFLMDHLDTMAEHAIVITQMFCEAFRAREIADMCRSKFVQGYTLPERLLIEEHGWSIASRGLQSTDENHGHRLHVADVLDERLIDEILHQKYDMLLSCGGKARVITRDDKIVMAIKYLKAWFGTFVKSRRVRFGSTDQVNALIHIFEEHVVLQYNHQNFPEVRVDAEASSSALFTKLRLQPIKELTGRSYVVFKRNEQVLTAASFSSNWYDKLQDVIVENLPSLSLEVSSKDFLTSVGTVNFYPELSELKTGRRSRIHSVHIHKTLYANKTRVQAKTALEELFDMKVLDNQVADPNAADRHVKNQKARDQTNKLIHGRYLNIFELFIEVSFNTKKVQVEQAGSKEIKELTVVDDTTLTVNCEGRACHNAIIEILKDWERKS